MGTIYDKYVGTFLGGSINVSKPVPIDVKTVVERLSDLISDDFLLAAYEGLVVYVVEEKSLFVCYTPPYEYDYYFENVEDCWKKLDVDYSVRIVEEEKNLTDGTTIMFPYQGMMAYVRSEESLYILLTKGISKAREIGNWKKISNSSSTLKDKVGINVKPEGGSGFMITENHDVEIEDYVNVENYIKADYSYTSKGVNSFDSDPKFTYDSLKLSKIGVDNAYIELFATGTDWIKIYNPVDLGLNINIGEKEYVSGESIAKKTPICFGSDIKFHEGWLITIDNVSRQFDEKDYELIDIYRSEYSPEVYAYLKDLDVRILTEDDLVTIDDKIDNMANSIMIDLDGDSNGSSDSDDEEPRPLQEVIVQMNNQISKLEQIKVEPETIEYNEIENLFQ